MKTIKGNLITMAKEGKFDVIVHGCNCYHVMGGARSRCIYSDLNIRCDREK